MTQFQRMMAHSLSSLGVTVQARTVVTCWTTIFDAGSELACDQTTSVLSAWRLIPLLRGEFSPASNCDADTQLVICRGCVHGTAIRPCVKHCQQLKSNLCTAKPCRPPVDGPLRSSRWINTAITNTRYASKRKPLTCRG